MCLINLFVWFSCKNVPFLPYLSSYNVFNYYSNNKDVTIIIKKEKQKTYISLIIVVIKIFMFFSFASIEL